MRAVVPCFNRRDDLTRILSDLAALRIDGIDLSVHVVDNASDEPLASVAVPEGLGVEFIRLSRNTGGSGGYNHGIARAIRAGIAGTGADYIWLVDSDARVRPDTLSRLVDVLRTRPDLVAVGPSIADPETGEIFEVGGRIRRSDGQFGPRYETTRGLSGPIACDYVAACCALVRTRAIQRVGLMPDVFLNADDVAWFIRLARGWGGWGGGVAAVPEAVACHPRFDRFPTWTRYYVTRNALGPIDELGLGRGVRLHRIMRDVLRSVQQSMMGRADLARLHLLGLGDAIRGWNLGRARVGRVRFEAFHPLDELQDSLEPVVASRRLRTYRLHPGLGLEPEAVERIQSALRGVGLRRLGAGDRDDVRWVGRGSDARAYRPLATLLRLVLGPVADLAVVPARGRPATWLAGRVAVQVTTQGFVIRAQPRGRLLGRSLVVAAQGTFLGLRAALKPTGYFRVGCAPAPDTGASTGDEIGAEHPAQECPPRNAARVTLGVVIVSFNRFDALRQTLDQLGDTPGVVRTNIVVVDNASEDGTPERLARTDPDLRVIRLEENLGVEAFNRGVAALESDLVLVLDDDARPEAGALQSALDLMRNRPDVAAIALHPRHPDSGRSEWPFGEHMAPTDRWPMMGCANLVRRDAWLRAGGYERDFFLYRNDTDLALTLLGMGRRVWFDPDWVVWHDSPAAARKSPRWHRIATRNWIWMIRRHGRGPSALAAIALGWARAHRLAGLSPARHRCTIRGAWDGLRRFPPPLTPTIRPDGSGVRRLLWIRLSAALRRTSGIGPARAGRRRSDVSVTSGRGPGGS